MKSLLEDTTLDDSLFSKDCLPRFEKDLLFKEFFQPNVTLWFQIHEAFDLILVCSQSKVEKWPQVQLYSFEHDFLSSLNGKFVSKDDVSQRLTAVLQEPYDNTTLSLNDDRFLWIKYGVKDMDISRRTLQIDVTSIDRSRVFEKR